MFVCVFVELLRRETDLEAVRSSFKAPRGKRVSKNRVGVRKSGEQQRKNRQLGHSILRVSKPSKADQQDTLTE